LFDLFEKENGSGDRTIVGGTYLLHIFFMFSREVDNLSRYASVIIRKMMNSFVIWGLSC